VKIARFSVDGGDPRYGILDGDDYVVLSGDPMFSGFGTTGERVAASDVKLLAPVIPRSKVVCIGLNYAAHRDELKNDAASPVVPNPLNMGSPESTT
jgi:2-keto-4-pentenoate hydratase/2-oxohepta-3-ene-1,7-dioic acid hydratase in catechol pathway